MALSKREVSAVLPATLELAHRCSTLALLLSSPYVQSRREYRAKTIRRPPNDLEDSENHRSAGGHGNQHVRLRSAQIEKRRSDLPGSGICEPGAAADVANIASRQSLAIGFFPSTPYRTQARRFRAGDFPCQRSIHPDLGARLARRRFPPVIGFVLDRRSFQSSPWPSECGCQFEQERSGRQSCAFPGCFQPASMQRASTPSICLDS